MLTLILGLVVGFIGGALFARRNLAKVDKAVGKVKTKLDR
jgi:uncharacterized protein YneF (UPF0154 family)